MVIFEESNHSYTNIFNGNKYVSATTLIGKYKEPFDSDLMSLYKAIQKYVISKKGGRVWEEFKKGKNPKTVVNIFNTDASSSSRPIVKQLQKDILKEWEYEKVKACFNGTNFHKAQEQGWLNKDSHDVKGSSYSLGDPFTIDVSNNFLKREYNIPKPLNELEDGVYTELTLWNDFFEIAGQADIVFIETVNGIRYVDIDDYKTNKEIKEKSFYHPKKGYKKMLYPLNTVMDCNLKHYNLQTSLYGYLLELQGYTVRTTEFQHWNNVGTKEKPSYKQGKVYTLPYIRKEVIKMLNHHKQSA